MDKLLAYMQKEQACIDIKLKEQIALLPDVAQAVADYILLLGGKRLRPVLCLLFGRLLKGKDADLYSLGVAIEMLHGATLLHDDIIDNALIRRGKPAAHLVYTQSDSILVGDILLAQSLALVASHGKTSLTQCISDAVLQTATGEIRETAQSHNIHLTMEEYLQIIREKTAHLLEASCLLGALSAGASEKYLAAAQKFGRSLGIAFQIVDDVLDFSPSSNTGKIQGGDIREGKVTLPLIYYCKSLSEEERQSFSERFTKGNFTEQEIEELCQLLHENTCLDRAIQCSKEYLAEASLALEELPKAEESEILREILSYVTNRSH